MIRRNPFYVLPILALILNLLYKGVQAACPVSCSTCDPADNTKCTKCNTGKYLTADSTCVDICPDGFYANAANSLCTACGGDCGKCSLSNSKIVCLQCINSTILNLTSMACVGSCQQNLEFLNATDPKNQTCDVCSNSNITNCGVCKDANTCKKCALGFYNKSTGQNEDMVIKSCNNCSLIGGSAGCNNCSYSNQVVNCYSCYPGYSRETNGTCVSCTSNCSICDRNRCKTCKSGYYPLYPNYKNCDKCSRNDQMKKTSDQYASDVCVYQPLPVTEMGKIRFDIFRGVQAAVYSNVCEDKGDLINVNYKIYYVCSIKEETINATNTKQDILNVLSKLAPPDEVTFPDYTDKDSKFYGKSSNNSILCPGKNNGIYYLRYFCENTFGMISAPSSTIKYRIPLSEGRQTQLLLLFDRNATELQRKKLVCKMEEIFGLKGKYLVRTPKGEACTDPSILNSTGNKRELSIFTGYENSLPIIVDHDPYSIRESDVSEGVMDIMYSSFNRSINTYFNGELVYLGFDSNQMLYSLVTDPITPIFKYRTRSKTSVVNSTQFVVRLLVTNVDSVVYVGFNANYSFRSRPGSVEELKWSKDIRTMYTYISRAGKENALTFTGLEPNTNYTFYFGAEELSTGNSTVLYGLHLITTSFGTILQNAFIGLTFTIFLAFFIIT